MSLHGMEAGAEGASGRDVVVPYFFGDEARRLYCCYHPPAAASIGEAALICNTTGHEYERCHRAMRQLAIQFARAGYPAMRFDYFGTGDSMGDYAQASLEQWRRDIAAAATECRRRSGLARLCLFGLRLGATLAAQAAADREDVTGLVLYAPVIHGASLLAEWRCEQLAFERKHGSALAKTPQEVLGFPLTDGLRAQLERELDLRPPLRALRRVLILAERVGDRGIARAAAVLKSRGAAVRIEQADGAPVWRREPLEAIVPFKLLRRIVAWMGEEG